MSEGFAVVAEKRQVFAVRVADVVVFAVAIAGPCVRLLIFGNLLSRYSRMCFGDSTR